MADIAAPDAEHAIAHLREQARQELSRRLATERGRYYSPNGRAAEFIELLGQAGQRTPGSISVFILRAGNSFGKTALAVNIANYLCNRQPNEYLDKVPFLKNFPSFNRGRICTTANAAKNTYAQELPKWLPRGKYKAVKKGRDFECEYNYTNGNGFDFLTFDQDPESNESITLQWAIVDEPMTHRHWSGLKSRLRFGGVIIMILTPLEGSGWYHDILEAPERLNQDVFVMEGSSEDNCLTHGVRGVIPHAALADMWKDFDETELPARRDGKYLHLSGAILKHYRDDESGHLWREMPEYYAQCWSQKKFTLACVIDPHDRKPFAIAWHAVFPNGHWATVAEWPDIDMPMFNKIRSWQWGVPEYGKMIRATEKALGKPADMRLIDPNFGVSAKKGGNSVCQDFEADGFYDFQLPPDSISDGHIKLKELIGNPAGGIAAHYHCMEYCRNTRYAMTHYGYRENRDERKGLSEIPELINKDFIDTIRYALNAGLTYVPQELYSAPHLYDAPVTRGNGYVGA